jgi:hypothetical protein
MTKRTSFAQERVRPPFPLHCQGQQSRRLLRSRRLCGAADLQLRQTKTGVLLPT